jgi:hypothetical protein
MPAPTATPTVVSTAPVIVDFLPAADQLIQHDITILGSNLLAYDKPLMLLLTPNGPPETLALMAAGTMPPDSDQFPGLDYLTTTLDKDYSWTTGTYTLVVVNSQGEATFTFDVFVECADCKPGRSRRGR